jgi:hypothetical protein
MAQAQEFILRRIGKALHVRMDDITEEALPRRWVELIHYLDEKERERRSFSQASLPVPARPALLAGMRPVH